MAETVNVKNIGLRGVTVADSKVSFIDGEKGILIYRGYRIEELGNSSTFPETAFLLLNGALPNKEEMNEFNGKLLEARNIPDFLLKAMKQFPHDAHPMDVLQASIPMLATIDPDLNDETREGNIRKAIRLIARLPIVVAAWHRIRNDKSPLPPDLSLSHAGNFLWLLNGEKPSEEMAGDLDTCLLLHADHTFNASTFTCRQVVSTKAHIYSGVAAGVGALSGSLHGGANERVMQMLLAVKNEDNIEQWVQDKIASGEKIMGMGHAVYTTTDPRASFLKETALRLSTDHDKDNFVKLAIQIEEAAINEFSKRGKSKIKANVDFYSATVYNMMGIPLDMMTPIFAISRVAGWAAHIIEEKTGEAQEKPVLYRPKAEYIGRYCGLMGCSYEPPKERED